MDHRIYSILSVRGYELHTYESTLAGYELLVLSLGELYQILDGCLQGLVLVFPYTYTWVFTVFHQNPLSFSI